MSKLTVSSDGILSTVYSSRALKYNFKVHKLSMYFHFPLCSKLVANIVLFTQRHLFDNSGF